MKYVKFIYDREGLHSRFHIVKDLFKHNNVIETSIVREKLLVMTSTYKKFNNSTHSLCQKFCNFLQETLLMGQGFFHFLTLLLFFGLFVIKFEPINFLPGTKTIP